MTLQEKLNKLLADIAAKNSLGDDMSEGDVEQLDKMNKEAAKLQARIDAEGLAVKHEENEKERIEREKDEAVKEALQEQEEKHEAAKRRPPFDGGAPYQVQYGDTWRYDNMDATDLSLFLEAADSMGVEVSNPVGAMKAMSLRVAELEDDNTEEGRKGVAYVKNAFKMGTKTNIDPTKEGVEAAIKAATDPMYSTGSNIGSDWVGTSYSNEIWAVIRGAVRVLQDVPSITVEDGYSSKYIPLESTSPTFYKVSEATAADATMGVPVPTVTASQAATANKQITLGTIGARTMYTGMLVEDSLVRFVPQLRAQLMAKGAEVLEHVAIDGDIETSASKNVNDIAGTPAGTEPFLLLDGFRKLALVTNTANSRDASGAFVVEDYKATLQLLGTAGLAGADPTKLAFIQDFNTMWAAMEIPELKTKDVHSAATIENGFLKAVYRVPVIDSYHMHAPSVASSYERKVNTAGKIDMDTDSNNSTGAILAVRFDQWKQAYKRRMTLETTRIANADSWEIVALLRWGMAYRDNEASAISYNVGV
ncbi:MAG: hypothetical protein GY774_40035 [Planctomycetes bacterium]|nr:hypothetical protein [Planctomycetota bacterium]